MSKRASCGTWWGGGIEPRCARSHATSCAGLSAVPACLLCRGARGSAAGLLRMRIAQADKDVATLATLRDYSGTTTTGGKAVIVPHSVQSMGPVVRVVAFDLGAVIRREEVVAIRQ